MRYSKEDLTAIARDDELSLAAKMIRAGLYHEASLIMEHMGSRVEERRKTIERILGA